MENRFAQLLTVFMVFLPALAGADTWVGEYDYEGKRHGTWTRAFDDTNISEIYNFRHDVQHGPFATFHASGQKSVESNFRDGLQHGEYASFHDNEGNTRAAVGTHTDGNRTGNWTEWHPNGEIHSEVSYDYGEPHGMAEYFYTSGGKLEIVEYQSGARSGIYVQFHDNGDNTIKSEGNLRNGRRYGEWTEWHSNDTVGAVANYASDQRHGPEKTWYDNGRILWETTYSVDLKHGHFIEYYNNEDNTKRFEGNYREGQRVGIWLEWGANGNLISEITYESDRMNGPARHFNLDDGTLNHTTVYMDDLDHGPYRSYHWPRLLTTIDPLASVEEDQEIKAYDAVEESGQHRSGQKVGEWTTINREGSIIYVSNWTNGIQNGVEEWFYGNLGNTPQGRGTWTDGWKTDRWTTWHDNGNIASQGSYVTIGDQSVTASVKSGAWGQFNRDGELVRVSVYENDELVGEHANCDHDGVVCPFP